MSGIPFCCFSLGACRFTRPIPPTTLNSLTNLDFTQGDPNASIPTVEPVISRTQFASYVPQTCVTFVSNASIASGTIASYNLSKRVEPVKHCRGIGKKDMKFNDVMPKMKVDPERYIVQADGVELKAEPAERVPLGQPFFIY